jgi:hypothetical protein
MINFKINQPQPPCFPSVVELGFFCGLLDFPGPGLVGFDEYRFFALMEIISWFSSFSSAPDPSPRLV